MTNAALILLVGPEVFAMNGIQCDQHAVAFFDMTRNAICHLERA